MQEPLKPNCFHFIGLISERDNFDTVRNFSNLESFYGYKFIEDTKFSKTLKNQHSNKYLNSIHKGDISIQIYRQFKS